MKKEQLSRLFSFTRNELSPLKYSEFLNILTIAELVLLFLNLSNLLIAREQTPYCCIGVDIRYQLCPHTSLVARMAGAYQSRF